LTTNPTALGQDRRSQAPKLRKEEAEVCNYN